MMIVFAKLAIENKLQNFFVRYFSNFPKKLRFDDVQGLLFFQTGQGGKYSDLKPKKKNFFRREAIFSEK